MSDHEKTPAAAEQLVEAIARRTGARMVSAAGAPPAVEIEFPTQSDAVRLLSALATVPRDPSPVSSGGPGEASVEAAGAAVEELFSAHSSRLRAANAPSAN